MPGKKETTVLSQEDTLTAVRQANERFYRAFESLDIERMAALWIQADRAKCVHPGWDLLEGWEAIRKSWEGIFANTDYMRFVITDVSVHVYGQVAWVTCVENLSNTPSTPQMARILATNIYEKSDTDWRLVYHHASPVMRPRPRVESHEELN
jgi:ketosteroid isomerase-like protein